VKRRMRFIGGILLLAGGIILLAGCGGMGVNPTVEAQGVDIMGPVKSAGLVVAEGEVVPARYAVLTFTVSGVVDEVLVEENVSANAGQVIARLEGKERLSASVSAAELAVLSAQQALDDLHENAAVRQAEAQLAVAEAETALDDALDAREKLDQRWGDQDQIDAAYARLIIAEQAVEDAQKDFDEYASWRAEDDVIRADFLARLATARDARDTAQAQLDYLESTPEAFEVSEADSQIEVARAQLEDANTKLAELQGGIDPDELALAEARLKDAQAQLEAAQKALADLELKAPFDGLVISSTLKEGEMASSTTAQVRLADVSKWQVETTDLTELNVVGIRQGMAATVTFDAVPDLELPGKVSQVKSLGVNKQGDITYTIVVELDKGDERLRWNMTAFVTFGE